MSVPHEFEIVFTADTTGAVSGMNRIAAEFKALEALLGNTSGGLGQMTANLGQMTAGLNGAADAAAIVSSRATSMSTSIAANAAGFLVIQAGVAAMTNLGDAANKARDHIKQLTEDTMKLRAEMSELANLKGFQGPDNELVGETVRMGMQAGLMPHDMTKYLEQFEGSSPAGDQKKHIDPATKAQLAIEGAKLGSRVGLQPKTAGDLAGVMSQYTDFTRDMHGNEVPQNLRIESAMEQMGRVVMGLNDGRGNLEPLTRSLINTAGSVVAMGGPVEDLGDLAQIQGTAATHANPKESGTRLRQAVRSLRDTTGKGGMFLTRMARIVDSDNHVSRLRKVRAQLDIAKKNGIAPDTFLKSVGMGEDQDEMKAVIEQANDLEIIEDRITKSHRITGRTVIQANDDYLNHTRVGQRKKSNAAKAGQEFLIGEENERIAIAKQNAEMTLIEDKKVGGNWNRFVEFVDNLGGLAPLLGAVPAREGYQYAQAEKSLVEEAERVGIPRHVAMQTLGYQEVGYYKPSANTSIGLAPGQARLTPAELREQLGPGMGMFGSPLNQPGIHNALSAHTRRPETGQPEWVGYGTYLPRTESSDDPAVKARFNKLADEVERHRGTATGDIPDLGPKFDNLTTEQRITNSILKDQTRVLRDGPWGYGGPKPPPPPPPPGPNAMPAAVPKRGP